MRLYQALEEFRRSASVVLLELDISPPWDLGVWNRYQNEEFDDGTINCLDANPILEIGSP